MLSRNSPLQLVLLNNVEGLKSGRALAFCSIMDLTDTRTATAFMGMLGAKLVRSHSDEQYCVTDTDGDGRVDMSFELNGGSSVARVAQSIAPVAFDVRDNVPVSSDDDRLSLVFLGADKRRLKFELVIVQNGKRRVFTRAMAGNYTATNLNYLPLNNGFPADAQIYGIRFTVRSFDKAPISWSLVGRKPKAMSLFRCLPR